MEKKGAQWPSDGEQHREKRGGSTKASPRFPRLGDCLNASRNHALIVSQPNISKRSMNSARARAGVKIVYLKVLEDLDDSPRRFLDRGDLHFRRSGSNIKGSDDLSHM